MALPIPTVLLASLAAAAAPAPAPAQAETVPVLVELFTSEGCSSCPPADGVLARLSQEQPVSGARVIALGEHVDYWDDLGWKDAFSSPLFTQRQRAYVHRLGLAGPYTPQLVIAGRLQTVGSDETSARRAIAAAAGSPSGSVTLRVPEDSGAGPTLDIRATWSGGAAEIVLAIVEDRVSTRVSRGENAGRTLTHVSAVHSMTKVGEAVGTFSRRVAIGGRDFRSPAHAVVFVQEPGGGRVHAASSVALPDRAASGR